MKKFNQQGSVIAIVLTLVLVTAIGGTGYMVYSRQSSKNTKQESPSTSKTVNQKDKSLEIPAIGIKVNDPDGRNLQLHAEKVCGGGGCNTRDSYFIRDSNQSYFDRCEYPAGISKLDASGIKSLSDYPDSYTTKHTKKIGNNYYYVFPGSHYQSPCEKLQTGDEQYEDSFRQYILDNIVLP